ncbi:hypothetical protein [Shimia sediminis]|uniref:hypothetical protein n=1 Tax=Shimia sediminis TaxID=2497945 RepID=UPI000F8EADDE|nr:hypothetical protein [Shimia sediminis]
MTRLATIFALTLLPVTSAFAENWLCTFPNQSVDGWLRGQVFINVTGQNATVFDSLINQEHGGPIAATVATNNDKRLTLRWDLKRVELRHGYAPRIRYTLSYIKDTKRANFTALAAELQDYRNSDRAGGNFNAGGTCTRK